MPMDASAHSHYSSYREMLLEHLFAGAVMRHLWLKGYTRLELLKPQVDDSGYDLVLEANGVTRHVQFKASFSGSKTQHVSIQRALGEKPSGCVIWIQFDPTTLELGPFLWFGGAPHEPLPPIEQFKIAKAPKGNAKGHKALKPNFKVVPKTKFEKLQSIDEVVAKLFGVFEPMGPGDAIVMPSEDAVPVLGGDEG